MKKFILNLLAGAMGGVLFVSIILSFVASKKDDTFYQSLKSNKDCSGVLMVVNGQRQTAYQCKHRLYFKVDGKLVEINNEQ